METTVGKRETSDAGMDTGSFTKVDAGTNNEQTYAFAYEFYAHGHYDEAKALFSSLVIKDTKNITYWLGLGACFQMLKQYNEALEAYAAAALLEVTETDPLPHFYAAQCFISINDIASALQALDSADTIANKDPKYEPLIHQINLIKNAWSSS